MPVINTERLILRPILIDDIDGVMRYVSNPNVAHYLPFESTQTREQTLDVIRDWLAEMERGTDIYFALLPNERFQQKLIGEQKISQKNKNWTLGCINIVFKDDDSISFGWCLAEEFWGMGIMPEALNMIIDFYKKERSIKYVQTLFHSDNIKSGKAMEKCGFKKNGEVHRPSTEDGHYGEDSIGIIMRKDLY